MTHLEFDKVLNQRIEKIKKVLASKAKEYAKGDRMHNFKRSAGFMRKTPETACWAFLMKHLTSIADLVDDIEAGKFENLAYLSNEKIGDAINYLVLLEALISERISNA